MKWWPFGKKSCTEIEAEQDENFDLAELRLKAAERKLAQTRAKSKEIAKAAASARRVSYKVDRYTEEIGRSFGRVNHG